MNEPDYRLLYRSDYNKLSRFFHYEHFSASFERLFSRFSEDTTPPLLIVCRASSSRFIFITTYLFDSLLRQSPMSSHSRFDSSYFIPGIRFDTTSIVGSFHPRPEIFSLPIPPIDWDTEENWTRMSSKLLSHPCLKTYLGNKVVCFHFSSSLIDIPLFESLPPVPSLSFDPLPSSPTL